MLVKVVKRVGNGRQRALYLDIHSTVSFHHSIITTAVTCFLVIRMVSVILEAVCRLHLLEVYYTPYKTTVIYYVCYTYGHNLALKIKFREVV